MTLYDTSQNGFLELKLEIHEFRRVTVDSLNVRCVGTEGIFVRHNMKCKPDKVNLRLCIGPERVCKHNAGLMLTIVLISG